MAAGAQGGLISVWRYVYITGKVPFCCYNPTKDGDLGSNDLCMSVLIIDSIFVSCASTLRILTLAYVGG
jgi:hypothetical protein